jgi:hypothetical protein
MNYLTVRKWDEWQSYRKDRQQPPWIKLHRELLRNPEWISLSDTQRGQLVSIWMLAADKNGRVPDDANLIARMCYMQKAPDLNLLIDLGFLDARVTPRRRQPDATVTPQIRGEEKIDKIQSGADAPLVIMGKVLDEEHAKAVIAYRTKGKQSNSPLALTRLANQLSKFSSPNEGAAEMICRGWKGFDPEWMHGQGRSPPTNGNGIKAPLQFRSEVEEIIKPDEAERARQVRRFMKVRAM